MWIKSLIPKNPFCSWTNSRDTALLGKQRCQGQNGCSGTRFLLWLCWYRRKLEEWEWGRELCVPAFWHMQGTSSPFKFTLPLFSALLRDVGLDSFPYEYICLCNSARLWQSCWINSAGNGEAFSAWSILSLVKLICFSYLCTSMCQLLSTNVLRGKVGAGHQKTKALLG